ncbi:hypothetical protein ACYJ1Y_12535 [Natrialbaceae archaeon A-gly3]
MTDSTIDDNTGDNLEVGPGAEELSGPFEKSHSDPPDETVGPHSPETELSAIESRVDEIADRTADDVFEQFEQLRSEANGECDVDGVLADESPDDIIASAIDEADDPAETGVLGDDDDREDLLVTGRRAGSEFLWVDPEVDEPESSSDASSSDAAASRSANVESAGTTAAEAVPEADLEVVPFGETGSKASPSDDGQASGPDGDLAERLEPGDGEDAGTVSGEDGSSGRFGWLRRKLSSIF